MSGKHLPLAPPPSCSIWQVEDVFLKARVAACTQAAQRPSTGEQGGEDVAVEDRLPDAVVAALADRER